MAGAAALAAEEEEDLAFPFNDGWRCEAFVPPDSRWCDFQADLAQHLATLPPAPVRIAWDPTRPEIIEALLAALYRDGCVLLLNAVDPELCAQIDEDMAPYLQAAQARHVREAALAPDSLRSSGRFWGRREGVQAFPSTAAAPPWPSLPPARSLGSTATR